MNTHVEGSYAKVEDALRAVDTLIMRGYGKCWQATKQAKE